MFSSKRKLGDTGFNSTAALILLTLTAAAIRFYALQNTTIINPDGPLYIHQAKAIAGGEWKAALCTLQFLSNVSFFISLFHLFLEDWLIAARAVSLFFGTLSVVPLYGLFRQFFPRNESRAASVILIFLPTWVYNSVDGVRDPVYWFFSLCGLYLLACGIREQRRSLLSMACISFLLATWARIEAIWYIAATFIFLPFLIRQFRYTTTLFWFHAPLLVAGSFLLMTDAMTEGPSLLTMSRIADLKHTITDGVPQYADLRNTLTLIRQNEHDLLITSFLSEARNLVWLIGLGTLGNRLCEALTYPFTFIALLGIKPFLRRQQDYKLVLFFALLAGGALALLYTRTLQSWVIEYRYMMLAILPGMLFFCNGLSVVADWFVQRVKFRRETILSILVILLVFITLPRYSKPRGTSEIAFKEIGLFLAAHHSPDDEIRITTSPATVRLIRFYANYNRPGLSCPERPEHLYTGLTANSLAELIKNLRERQIDYLLWEENNAPNGWHTLLSEGEKEGKLQELGRWHNHQTGKMVLYQVKKEEEL
jgi:4-amino-4-deoxy-L-arabinose transferase-like glycosyltransferase